MLLRRVSVSIVTSLLARSGNAVFSSPKQGSRDSVPIVIVRCLSKLAPREQSLYLPPYLSRLANSFPGIPRRYAIPDHVNREASIH